MINIVATRRYILRQNASNSTSVGAPPRPLRELTVFLQSPDSIQEILFLRQ